MKKKLLGPVCLVLSLVCCVGLTPQASLGDIVADSVTGWSATGTQGENGWYNGYFNLTLDGDGIYQPADFIEFLNDGSGVPETDPVEVNHWDGSGYNFEANPPWTELYQEDTHPSGANNAVEHWPIRRWISDYDGPAKIETQLRATNTGGSGTTNMLYVNGALIHSHTTNSDAGANEVSYMTLAAGDVVELALTPVGAGGETDREDGGDGSAFRLTITDELPLIPPLADSVDDWSATGTQGENGWTNGYYNLTTDGDGAYQPSDLIPFLNDGSGVPETDPVEVNHWNGAAYDFEGNPPWTYLAQQDTHPTSGSDTTDEHWTIRVWEAGVTETTRVAIEWQTRATNTGGTGVTGLLFVNDQLKDAKTIRGNDEAGVARTYFYDLQPGDKIALAHSPEGIGGDRTDGSDGSANRLIVRDVLPEGPLYNPLSPRSEVANSAEEWSATGTQGENGWSYGYYDQRDDVENGDGVYGTGDFTEFLRDGTVTLSETNQWNGGSYDMFNGNPPWTTLDSTGGHPAAPADVHWAVRRWVSDHDGLVRIEGVLNNVSAGDDGTVGRIFVDGVEIYSGLSDGDVVHFAVDTAISSGSIIDFAIDPDGSGVFDISDPSTLNNISDGNDSTGFWVTIEEIELIPEPSSVILVLSGLIGVAVMIWRRRR